MNGLALAAALVFSQGSAAEAEPAPAAAPPPAVERAAPEPAAAPATTPAPPRRRAQAVVEAMGRDEAERAARQFLEALVRGDAGALAAAAADRFSFDGDVQAGRETIRRTWRDLLAARPAGPAPAVGSVELLQAEEAAARFGKPPLRLAPLVRKGVTVAVADVGGRTVVLFLAREGSRTAVLGMHD